MRDLQKCAVINDLSGFGRSSLTVAIPVISALGIQTCPLPTAILSNHTDYPDFYFEDFTARMRPYFEQWEKLKLHFDAIYTGFLGSEQQIDVICDFIARFQEEDTLFFVDPVMGDHGSLYATYDAALCAGMRRLVRRANVITPNLTEACLLADIPYTPISSLSMHESVFQIADRLLDMGPDCVIITGVRTGDRIYNFVRTRKENERFCESTPFIAQEYCGTGDLFSSLLCGYLRRGVPHREALLRAQAFLVKALTFSAEHHTNPLDGVAFEPFLKEL